MQEIVSVDKVKINCEKMILAFSHAFLFEPANVSGSNRLFVHHSPKTLPNNYLNEFAAHDTKIDDTGYPTLETCIFLGDEGEKHNFLSTEGLNNYEVCSKLVCRYCVVSSNEKSLCFACYNDMCDYTEQKHLSMKEMLADLNNVGVNVPKEVQLHQLLQLHSSYVTEKVAEIDSEQIKLVKYLLLNSDEIRSIKFKPTLPRPLWLDNKKQITKYFFSFE